MLRLAVVFVVGVFFL